MWTIKYVIAEWQLLPVKNKHAKQILDSQGHLEVGNQQITF